MSPTDRQRRLTLQFLRAIKRQIREVQGPDDGELAAYYQPYSEMFTTVRGAEFSRERFASVAAKESLVLVGDFHTLDQAQHTYLHVLQDLVGMGIKPRLGLEAVHAMHQQDLDRFMAGKMREKDFLDAIGYFKDWGFDFTHYAPILAFAREHGLAVFGINEAGSLAHRDTFVSGRIQELLEGSPAPPFLVLVGDLHLAPTHLPALLSSRGLAPVILYQNSETVYTRRLLRGKDPFGWWSLGRKRYLTINTPPTVKMLTYLVWIEHGGEALSTLYGFTRGAGTSEDGEADIAETVASYAKALKHLFDLHGKADDDFQVYLFKDLDFLKGRFFKSRAGKPYARLILDARPTYIERTKTLYLPTLDVNRTAQETMHYLMRAELPTARSADAFMRRIHYFACGYLASKMINPMRHSPTLTRMREKVESYPWLAQEKDREKLWREIEVFKGTLAFFQIVRSSSEVFLVELAPLLEKDTKTDFALSEQIGRTLGDELCAAYDAGRLSALDLKHYCFAQNDPLYFERLAERPS